MYNSTVSTNFHENGESGLRTFFGLEFCEHILLRRSTSSELKVMGRKAVGRRDERRREEEIKIYLAKKKPPRYLR